MGTKGVRSGAKISKKLYLAQNYPGTYSGLTGALRKHKYGCRLTQDPRLPISGEFAPPKLSKALEGEGDW